jgi:hypothetical protein
VSYPYENYFENIGYVVCLEHDKGAHGKYYFLPQVRKILTAKNRITTKN